MTEINVIIDDETAATLQATAKILNIPIGAVAAMVVTRYAQRNHEAVTGALKHVDS